MEYRLPATDPSPPRGEKVFALLLLEQNTASILVHRSWRQIISQSDQGFVLDLLKDFRKRLVDEPEALFAQASHLSMGAVITYSAGSMTEESPWLAELRRHFVPF